MTETKVLGGCVVSGKEYMLYVVATDETSIEITVRDIAGVLRDMKDILFGRVLTSFWLSVGTASEVTKVQFLDKKGGIVYEWLGSTQVALGKVPQIVVEDCQAHITKGSHFEITTAD